MAHPVCQPAVTRLDLIRYIFECESTPNSEDFDTLIELFLWEHFPHATQNSIDSFINGYVTENFRTLWSFSFGVRKTLTRVESKVSDF